MRGKRKKFTSSDDLLIRQQPATGMSLKRLASLLRTTQAPSEGTRRFAGHWRCTGGNIDTRTLRSTDGFVDPLLERLKNAREK
jgi:hypothetical protein